MTQPLHRQHRYLEHPWGKIATVALKHERSAKGRPWLVFLHEALGSIAMWKDIPEQLAQSSGCNALIYDRLGHGDSDPLPRQLSRPDYLDRESREILPFVLNASGIDRAVLIGHSDGGSIALLGASEIVEGVAGIVTEAAHVFVEQETLDGILATTEAADVATLKEKVSRYHQQDIEPIFQRWPRIWLAKDFSSWSIEKVLAKIVCPVLVLQGEQDDFGTERQVHAIASGCGGPAHQVLISDCGHVPHFQSRNVYLDEVNRFLAQVTPQAPGTFTA